MQSTRARRLIQILTVALVLFFFGLALLNLAPQIKAYRWQLDPFYLALAFVLLVVRGPVPAYGWWAIMRQLGQRLPFWRSVRMVNYSALANFVPGSMWYAVSRVYLAEREGIPRLVTAISVGIETVMVLLGAVIVSAFSLIAWHDAPIWAGAGVLAALALFVASPQALFRLLNWGLARMERKPVEVKLSAGDMLRLLWPFVLNWLLYGAMSFALVAALYPALSVAQAPVIAGLFTASWLGGYLAVFVPQGLVIRELFITSLLVSLAGVPTPVAAAAAVLSRAWSILGVALWAAISTRL